MGFYVNKKQCDTCIYRKRDPEGQKLHWDTDKLEEQIKDEMGFFQGYRICHDYSVGEESQDDRDVCCRGFWNRHKDKFPGGQIAQRLYCVIEVES